MRRKTQAVITEEWIAETLQQDAARRLQNGTGASSAAPPASDRETAMAERLYQVLRPVEPSEQFVAELKARLAAIQQNPALSATQWKLRQERARQRGQIVRVVVAAVAIGAVLARLAASALIIIGFIIRRRRRTASAA